MLLLAFLAAIATVLGAIVIIYADAASDAPSQDGISPVPWVVGGVIITCILLLAWWLG